MVAFVRFIQEAADGGKNKPAFHVLRQIVVLFDVKKRGFGRKKEDKHENLFFQLCVHQLSLASMVQTYDLDFWVIVTKMTSFRVSFGFQFLFL